MAIRVEPGNCLEVMRRLAEEGVKVDAVVTDPPYGLNFMGQKWDGPGVVFNSVTWGTAASLLKPGGHLLAFGGTRTFGKLQWAIEGGGFEVRDMVTELVASDASVQRFMASLNAEQQAAFLRCLDESRFGGMLSWLYGQGFSKVGMEKNRAPERFCECPSSETTDQPGVPTRCGTCGKIPHDFDGFGGSLKPACEPICLARKCLSEPSVAANLLKHGTGALNVDGCRVETDELQSRDVPASEARGVSLSGSVDGSLRQAWVYDGSKGRWPANVVHDGSDEVEDAFAAFGESKSSTSSTAGAGTSDIYGEFERAGKGAQIGIGDTGTASRFFYSAKADAHDRWGSRHPTVKPIDLMRWLVRLVTPPGGTVLDPFAGSGTTAVACLAEGFDCIVIEREEEYLADIRERLAFYSGEGRHSLSAKGRKRETRAEDLPLFNGIAVPAEQV